MSGKWLKYGVGLDLSKDRIQACFGGLTPGFEFKVIAQRKFDNTNKGWQELDKWLGGHRKDHTVVWRVVLEVTGVYHEGVLHYLHSKGIPVCMELPRRTKKYLESIGHKSKNDKLDGLGLARMACERECTLWQPTSEHIMAIRALLRHRKALLLVKNQLTNQLHALNHAALDQKAVKKSLKQLIKPLQKQILEIETQALKLAKEDKDFYQRIATIVNSVKGLGFISVLIIVAEANGFEYFHSAKQLVNYAGLDIIERSSGQSKSKTRISKQGNAHIRAALYMPTLAIIRLKVQPFYALYLRLLVRNGGIKQKAAVALHRKLLILIYTLWKNNVPFDPEYHLKFNAPKMHPTTLKTGSSDFASELHEIVHAQECVTSH